MKIINGRTTKYDIHDLFLNRYSPRAMSGEVITKEELMTLFEAARWAPSSRNEQPWRFLYATKGTSDFDLFLSFLLENNQTWCKNAGVLVIGLSRKTLSDGTVNTTHSLDTGSAWENLALQGTAMGLVVHGMGGYSDDLLRKELHIQDDYMVELMVAIGKPGRIEDLPEKLQEREQPSQRKNLDEIVFEGKAGVKNL
ncbi:MAG: nitroreductase family protein [Minisyncoccia bacterium]